VACGFRSFLVDMPVKWPPDTTLAEIREAAAELLPGSRVRRLLFFRYALEWTQPGDS
jgi:hypothetical protein